MIQFLFVFSDWALLALRIVLGAILVIHGWPKIKDLKSNAKSFKEMGFVPGSLWGTITAFIEFVGGILIVLGLLTQLISFLVFVQFLIILVTVKAKAKFKGDVEFDLLILVTSAVLLTMGGGIYSFDHTLNFLIY